MHLPPEENWQSDHSSLDSKEIAESDREGCFDAMIEAMDTQIGRLLGSMDSDVRDNTYVIFLSDNGTARANVRAPFRIDRASIGLFTEWLPVPDHHPGP